MKLTRAEPGGGLEVVECCRVKAVQTHCPAPGTPQTLFPLLPLCILPYHTSCPPFSLLGGMLWPAAGRAQSIPRAEADSLSQLLAASRPDTNRVKWWLRLGEFHLRKPGEFNPDLDSAAGYAHDAKKLSLSLRFQNGYVRSQNLLMDVYLEGKRLDKAHALLNRTKPGRLRANLLVSLGQYYLYKAGEFEVDLDSAEQFVRQAMDLYVGLGDGAGRLESLAVLGVVLRERGNPGQARIYLNQVIPLIEQTADPATRAVLWSRLGDHYARSEAEMPDKIRCYAQSMALYRHMGNKEREAHLLKTIADMHQVQGKYAESLRELLEVLRMQKSIGFSNLHYTYDLLGYVHRSMGNYEHALPFVLATIKSAKTTGDSTDLDLFYLRVADTYKELGQPGQALEAYQLLLAKLQREDGNVNFILTCIGEIHGILSGMDQPGKALAFLKRMLQRYPPDTPYRQSLAHFYQGQTYRQLHDYARAEGHFLEALALDNQIRSANSANEGGFAIDVNLELSKLYAGRGQYQKASYYLERAFALAEKQPKLLRLSRLYLQAFRVDSLRGNAPAALAHYQQYKALTDSIFNERKSNQLIAYQVQYNTQQKEQDLKLKAQDIKLKEKNIALLIQQSKAQQALLGQRQTERNALIGGAILLLLLLALGYNRYRLKQRSNQQLQARQEEINGKNHSLQLLLDEKEWLLREIHHRVKNNLQIVMSLLNSQADLLEDKAALSAIRESQHRVQAMALIHQKLYQSDGMARVPVKAYIEEVVAYLSESYQLAYNINFTLQVDDLELDVTQAVPLGLIVNEAMSNALKHAFPGNRTGTVSLSVGWLAENTYQLIITDDGIGLPVGYDLEHSRSLGMTLLQGFGRQLGGELTVVSPPGTTIRLVFEKERFRPVAAREELGLGAIQPQQL
jgi:two-component sensor histidine kinase